MSNVHLCLQHISHDAVHHAGLSVTAETCIINKKHYTVFTSNAFIYITQVSLKQLQSLDCKQHISDKTTQ